MLKKNLLQIYVRLIMTDSSCEQVKIVVIGETSTPLSIPPSNSTGEEDV